MIAATIGQREDLCRQTASVIVGAIHRLMPAPRLALGVAMGTVGVCADELGISQTEVLKRMRAVWPADWPLLELLEAGKVAAVATGVAMALDADKTLAYASAIMALAAVRAEQGVADVATLSRELDELACRRLAEVRISRGGAMS